MNSDIFSKHMKILVFIRTCGKDEFEGQSSLNQSPTSLATQFSKTTHADIKYTEYLPLHAIFFVFYYFSNAYFTMQM